MDEFFHRLNNSNDNEIFSILNTHFLLNENQKYFILLFLCEKGFNNSLQFLINCDIDVNWASREVLSLRHLQTLLLNDVNIKGDDYSAIHYASRNGHLNCLLSLLSAGALIDKPTKHGRTALHYAAEFGHIDCVKLLIEAGAKINSFCENRMSPLHYAVENGYLEVIQELCSNGADINAPSEEMRRPIHYAAENGYASVLQLLINYGTIIEDTETISCLSLAVQSGSHECVKILLEAGFKDDHAFQGDDIPTEIRREYIWHKRKHLIIFTYQINEWYNTKNLNSNNDNDNNNDNNNNGMKDKINQSSNSIPKSITNLLQIQDLLRMITEYIN